MGDCARGEPGPRPWQGSDSARSWQALRSAHARDGRRLHPPPGGVLHRRVELPGRPAVVAFPRHADEVLAALAVVARRRRPAHRARRRHVGRRQRRRARHRPRHLAAPEPGARHRPRGADGAGRARRGDGRPAAGSGAARPAVRPRPVDVDPRHPRRDDRQQRLRPARRGLRRDRRERARRSTGSTARGRRFTAGSGDRRLRAPSPASSRPRRRRARPAAHRARPVRPPGLGLLARAPAAGERVATSREPSSAPRAPAVSCSRPSSTSCRIAVAPRRWWCSATPTCPPRPTPSPPCSRHRPLAIEGMDARLVDARAAATGGRRPSRSCRREAAG